MRLFFFSEIKCWLLFFDPTYDLFEIAGGWDWPSNPKPPIPVMVRLGWTYKPKEIASVGISYVI